MQDQELGASTDERAPKRSLEQRLQFIDFRLQWEGRLNRGDLTRFFGISVPQASLDLSRYQELAPHNAEYDRSARTYVATKAFAPLYSTNRASRYLNEVVATARGVLSSSESFLGWAPPVEIAPVLSREPDTSSVVAIVRAIRDKCALRVRYQSLSRSEPLSRAITPHAMVNNGLRWHVRAFCHTRQLFIDFVIGRILEVEGFESGQGDVADDSDWHNKVSFLIQPNPGLSDTQRGALEQEYGMADGVSVLECRRALAFYVARRLDLLPRDGAAPSDQQLVLKNWEDLEATLKPTAG